MMILLTKGFVAVNAVIWMAFGPVFYFAPETFAGYLDIALQSPTALADFRAMYGGIPLGVGVFMVMGLIRKEWMEPALMVILLGTTGLLVGRLLTLVDTGGVSGLIYFVGGLEAGTIIIGAWLYRNLERTA